MVDYIGGSRVLFEGGWGGKDYLVLDEFILRFLLDFLVEKNIDRRFIVYVI